MVLALVVEIGADADELVEWNAVAEGELDVGGKKIRHRFGLAQDLGAELGPEERGGAKREDEGRGDHQGQREQENPPAGAGNDRIALAGDRRGGREGRRDGAHPTALATRGSAGKDSAGGSVSE